MTDHDRPDRPPLLLAQLRWYVRLRWVAAVVMVVGSFVDRKWLSWYPEQATDIALAGLTVLGYNAALWVVTHRTLPRSGQRALLLALAWGQILLDLGCLALLMVWTGGPTSPVLGFFVFHMVFASLLMPRFMAYAGAAMAMLLVCGALWLFDLWPATRDLRMVLLGWVVTLLFTVYLTNHITRSLRRQRRRLVRQNRRIHAMSRRLGEQQQSMIQHEKMVALGQMAAGIAHEINNPLASMDSVLQLVERNPERLKPERVVALRQQVDRIRQTIQHMSDFSHPTELDWQVVPIDELVATALAAVRFDRRHRNIDVEQTLRRPSCRVRVQPHAVQQVLVNILLNAFDAVDDVSSPRVTIGSECCDTACRIAISDNGPGVNAEYLDQVFQPFFTTKPVGRGTGLGLAISERLVRDQDGSITVSNKPGGGATFVVSLPPERVPPIDGAEASAGSQ